MTTSTYAVNHIRVEIENDFAEVCKKVEQQLGKYDPTVFQFASDSAEDIRSRIEAMAGTSGFMLFGTTDHGALLSVFGNKRRAIQYVVGNPLIAIEMTRHNLAAGLYVPLRVLVYEDDRGRTCVEYDKPSSLLGQFDDDRIRSVATMLDRKLDELVSQAARKSYFSTSASPG
jgi:uncharacterized protein (DUF302 family)